MGGPPTKLIQVPPVVYRKLDPFEYNFPDLSTSKDTSNLAQYGYNSTNDHVWEGYSSAVGGSLDGGGRYLRWLQPMETELAKQVEYDMDEQDQIWLDMLNADRKKEGHTTISYEVFEIIMDKIEKEWFDLTKNIPKKAPALPFEDSKCAICDDDESENSNAIVFCDGCNLAVHQDCYGVPYIPEGQWLCRKCTVSPEKPVLCVLCPNPYGAFKQTTTAQWAHLLCAIWIPDTGVSNTVYMEPVDGVDTIVRSRWKLICYLCKKRVGACIQCANRSCYTAFHVTCAREYGLELKMKNQEGVPKGDLKAYCDKHGERPAPPTLLRALTQAKARGGSAAQFLKLSKKKTFKTARGYNSSSSSAGPPVIPAVIAEKVMQYIAKIKLAGKKGVVDCVSRYWSLKREARRGAPLLKRIHLEPWTASATSHRASDADKAHKLELLRLLRNDLEKVRMLTEQVRKREKKKLERAVAVKGIVEGLVWPKEAEMRRVLGVVKSFDKSEFFLRPVDRLAVPDYHDVIKFPMDWTSISDKLDKHEYAMASDFIGDINLVFNNARRYNKPYTPVHKAALRLLDSASPLLAPLSALDDPSAPPAILSANLVALLDEDGKGAMASRLFEMEYDTTDPDGSKEKGRVEEGERRVREEEARVGREKREVEEEKKRKIKEEKEKEEKEKKSKAAAATKGKQGGKVAAALKAKGKGKGKARASPSPSDAAEEDDDDTAMDVDPPASAAPPTAAATKGKKRSALLAGLDDTPAPASRTRGVATPVPASAKAKATPAPAPAAKGRGGGRVSVASAATLTGKKGKAAAVAKEEDEEESATTTAAVGASRRGRTLTLAQEMALAAQADPSVKNVEGAEAIGKAETFKFFETGWVLPEGSRRRSGAVLPTPMLTPAPAASTSKLTAAPSTAKGKGKGATKEPTPAPAPKRNTPRASLPPPAPPAPSSSTSKLPPSTAAEEPTPAPAPPAPVKRNAPRGSLPPPPSAAAAPALSFSKPPPASRKGKGKAAAEISEELTDLEESEGDGAVAMEIDAPREDKDDPAAPTPSKVVNTGRFGAGSDVTALKAWEKKLTELVPSVAVTDETELGDGYLVWARLDGHPWWPSEVVDPEADDLPVGFEKRPQNWEKKVAVYYFGDKRMAAWVPRERLRQLGENDEFDQVLLDPLHIRHISNIGKKRQMGKEQREKLLQEVKDAYEMAKDRMESDDEEPSTAIPSKTAGGKKGGAKRATKKKATGKRQR